MKADVSRRDFVKTMAAGMAFAGTQLMAQEKRTRKTNIIYIFADQMRAHAFIGMLREHVRADAAS